MKEVEALFREVLVYIGDLNRMDIRLNTLTNKAKKLGVEIEDLPESKKTIKRLKYEANVLHDKVDGQLDGIN